MKKVKKFLCLMMTMLLALGTLLGNNSVLDVKAENGANQILRGTPLFDGQVDEMYHESLTLTLGDTPSAYPAAWSGDTGTLYFLYDNTYLYICAAIMDASVCTRGDIYVSGNNPNQNDNCEFRLRLNEGVNGATGTTFKVGIDAYGMRAYGTNPAEMEKLDYSKIQYKTTVNNGVGYVIEAAIPHTDGGILDLLNAGKLGFRLQLNDLDSDGSYHYYAATRENADTTTATDPAKQLVYYSLSEQMVTGGDVNQAPPMIEDKVEVTDYKELSFEKGGQYVVYSNYTAEESGLNYRENNGHTKLNEDLGTVDVSAGGVTNWYINTLKSNYKLTFKFNPTTLYDANYKYVRVLYAATNPEGAENVQMMILNDGDGNDRVYFEDNVTNTNGGFVLSSPAQLSDKIATRFTGGNNSIMFTAQAEGGLYQIKSLYFFDDVEEANNFELPSDDEKVDFQKLSFADPSAYYKPTNLEGYGNSVANMELGTIDFVYGNVSSDKRNEGSQYLTKVGFAAANVYDPEYKYLRVLYSATNPTGVDEVQMKLYNDKNNDAIIFAETVKNTNGEFKLSSVEEMTATMLERYQARAHMSYLFMTGQEGADYKIKAVYFFKTKEDAEAFTPASELAEIQINDTDISQYRVVVPVDGIGNEYEAAQSIVAKIYGLTEKQIPIVYDSEPATEYEILIGNTNRTESRSYYEAGGEFHPSCEYFSVAPYRIEKAGNKLVFVAASASCVTQTAELFNWLCNKGAESGEGVTITDDGVVARGMYVFSQNMWAEITNVENPEQFTDSFDADEGYWTTDSEKQAWVFAEDGDEKVLSTGDSTNALSYLHVWEKNVSFETKLKASNAQSGQVGLLLRHTADEAYVKLGYDYGTKQWFIDVREGADFLKYRLVTQSAELTADTWYDVKAVVDGSVATLYVNGGQVLTTDDLVQLTTGRIGVFADGAAAMIDDVNISLLSGLGTLWKNTVHTKLPGEQYREGGSVTELTDGTLIYQGRSFDNACFTSDDNGKSWTERDIWSDAFAYPNILRLENGNLLRINRLTIDDASWYVSQISTDDGASWSEGVKICQYYHGGETTRIASNMNDKLSQISSGRIFYVQSHEAKSNPIQNQKIFCEIYYSDDNGTTWIKSEDATYDIVSEMGMSDTLNYDWFAECKILETADGTLRMYCTHNKLGYMIYSESKDNGVTWGAFNIMNDFPCSTSSMQFVKDTYADNDTTYYMVWCQNDTGVITTGETAIPRSRLALAKSTDGINWVALGDVWHWESKYTVNAQAIMHIVDPFVKVTEDYVLVGSGLSEKVAGNHHAQRQHIWSVEKSSLEENLWKFDDTSHWQESIEGVKVNVTAHTSTGENTCPEKAVCDICEAEYTSHNYDTTTWKSDADGHWHECICQAKTDEAAHTPGAAATATTAQTCTECGYELAPATGETDSDSSDSDTTDSDTTDSDTTDSDTTDSDTTDSDTTDSDSSDSDTTDSDTDTDTGSDGSDSNTNTDSNDDADVTVDDDNSSSGEDNTLSAETTSGAVNASSTSTGDTSNILLWIMLAAGATIAAVLVVLSRKKNSN